jgi:hypothetical protein
MESEKISLDIRESTKVLRYFQLFFSLLSFIVAIWFLLKLLSTCTLNGSNGIAVIFLLFFGGWELVSGLGITQRYLIVSGDSITLKHRYFAKPVVFKPEDIKVAVFKPLTFIIIGINGERTVLKLGNYYQERTLKAFDLLSNFCQINKVAVEGLDQEEK